MEWSTVSKAADKSRRMSESDLTTIHRKDEVIVNFKKSSFSRMKDPVSWLKRRRQWVRRQVRLNAGSNNFLENFGNEDEVWNWTKVVEIIKWIEMVFWEEAGQELVWMTMENSFRKREIDKICDDWTEFIEAEFQKESRDGIQGTLFTFRSRNEFVNFSESGWNKIGHLWRWGRWKKKGSGEWDGKNLVRMRSILSLKKSRNVLAREDVSGDSGSEFEGFRWRIVFRVVVVHSLWQRLKHWTAYRHMSHHLHLHSNAMSRLSCSWDRAFKPDIG